jgi:hypothetical protein
MCVDPCAVLDAAGLDAAGLDAAELDAAGLDDAGLLTGSTGDSALAVPRAFAHPAMNARPHAPAANRPTIAALRRRFMPLGCANEALPTKALPTAAEYQTRTPHRNQTSAPYQWAQYQRSRFQCAQALQAVP